MDAASFGQNAYFYDAAEGLLTATILLVAEFCAPEKRHIVSVFKVIQELLVPSKKKGKNQFQQLNRIPPQKRPMTEAEILRRRELRRAAIKKQKRRRTLFLTACALAAVLLIAGIVLLCRSCGRSEGSPHDESIYSSFAMSDRSCVYTFREDGSGELRLSGAPYKFRFALSGRTLSIDFEAEALTDCEYEVAYIDTGLELTAGKGTATQGEKFTLNRTEK